MIRASQRRQIILIQSVDLSRLPPVLPLRIPVLNPQAPEETQGLYCD